MCFVRIVAFGRCASAAECGCKDSYLLASASCVSSKKYAALKAERDGLFNDWTTVKGNYARQQAENQTIQALLDEARRNNEQLRADYAAMQSTLNQSISSNIF